MALKAESSGPSHSGPVWLGGVGEILLKDKSIKILSLSASEVLFKPTGRQAGRLLLDWLFSVECTATLGQQFFFAEWSVWRKYFNFTWSPFQIIIGSHFTLEQVNIAAIRVVPTPIISKDSGLVDPNWVSAWVPAVTVSSHNKPSASSPQQSGHNGTNNKRHPQKILHLYNIWDVSDMKSVECCLSCGCHFHYVHLSLLALLATARNVLSPLLPLLPLILTFAWMCKTWSVWCLIWGG